MNADSIMSVSAAVVALTQLVKWSGVNDKYGPIAVMLLSLFGVAFWGWTTNTWERATAFQYFTGWIAVATSAAGIFGYTRASSEAITKTSSPPAGGAGGSATIKP